VPRLITLFYLASPLFLVADVALGINVRTAVFGDSPLRFLYYAATFGCGVAGMRRPALAPLLGMAESGLNIVMLVLGLYLPIWRALDALEGVSASVAPPFGAGAVVNTVLSGAVLLASFYGNQALLVASRR